MTFVSQGIGFVPIPGAGAGVSALTELLEDPELSTRASVVPITGRARNAESDDLLRRAVSDKDWTVRAAAAQIIAQSARLICKASWSYFSTILKTKCVFVLQAPIFISASCVKELIDNRHKRGDKWRILIRSREVLVRTMRHRPLAAVRC